MTSAPILEVHGLTTCFLSAAGVAKAVDAVSLNLSCGETLAVVGESGCGKTVLALSILRLVPDPPGRVTDGLVLFRGQDLLALPEAEMQRVRGNKISMIFQEPMTSLNPVFRAGEQVAEAVRLHQGLDATAALDKACDMLGRVGLPNPRDLARSYPHELSGGQRQRVMIAMALACEPDILIADEPTTALDVTIQAQILDLMADLRARQNGATLLITHDLGVVARTAQRVLVMYAGRVVEEADVLTLFHEPKHPYTQGLLGSLPRPGSRARLASIPGQVPGIFELPPGCRFHPRCPKAFERCPREEPRLLRLPDKSKVRCWLYEDESRSTEGAA